MIVIIIWYKYINFLELELVEYTYFPDNPNEPSSYEDDNINKENKTNIQSKDKLFNKTIKRKEDKNW